ncbi:hypothetical protein MTR67_019921 [Solanum verrucosum]|uniref:MULE transposase domain-containing protein n=1 Tax=Solanum verrucosum TaxID=315347 RepID=A0AAF0QNH5_SOLVR|nr:hypothetical protein MTR67_019921 [Solanum verrucosum]
MIIEIIEQKLKKLLCPPLEIGYLNDVGGESNTTFDKESSQTFEGSEGLGFEETAQPAQPEEPIVGEVLGRTSAIVGEDLGRASAGVERTWVGILLVLEKTWVVLFLLLLHLIFKKLGLIGKVKQKQVMIQTMQIFLMNEKMSMGKKAGDDPYFDSDEAVSFEIDTDEDVNEEDEVEQPIRRQRKARRAKRNKKKVVFHPTCQVRVKCTAGCPWLLFGSIDSRTGDFVVKNYNPVHKCNGTTKNKLVNSKYLSERYKDRIISEPGIRVFQFQILVKKELNVYVGRIVARKARNIVLKQIMGDHVEEFKRILDYRDELLKTNPGSTCVVRLSEETFEGDRKMFQSFYICFDALKKAFKAGARRCIGFDGCFLKGVSRGQLLVVVCKDGNNQMLPLAWAVVEVENTFTWKWFIKLGLDKAIQDLLPNAEQRMCARHVLANWSKNWKGIERRNCFWRCAKSTYEQKLKRNLDHMEKLGTGICDDLLWYNIERWSKLYFKFFSCCDSVDNNMAESFNSWILGPRHKTIITMLEEINIKVMRRIGQLREFCDTWITNISPMALKSSATRRGRGTATGNGIGIGVAADSSGATRGGRGTGTGLAGRGRRTSVVATATDVPGATGGGKRPRMVGMGILHTHSGFTIHNPGMPMNSSIVTENLGHHKPRSGLKWKGKTTVTQQGLQEMRENKRMRTRSNAAEV